MGECMVEVSDRMRREALHEMLEKVECESDGLVGGDRTLEHNSVDTLTMP